MISMCLRYALWLLVAIRLLIPVQFAQSTLSVENVVEKMPPKEQVVLTIEADYHSTVQEQPPVVRQEGVSSEQLLRGVWYIGIGVMSVWYLAVNAHFYYKARRGAKRLILPNVRFRVYISDGVSSPCLIGTSIFLTPEIASDESKRAHVLAHEMTHFYHADSLWVIVRAVCLCIYWFHPLVWCAATLSKQDCELACDEAAIKRLGECERYSYGKTLICVASQATKVQIFHTATTMSQSKKQMIERIKAIAKKQKRSLTAVLLMIVILAVTSVSVFTGSAEKKADSVQEQPQSAQELMTQYPASTQVITLVETTVSVCKPSTQIVTEEMTQEMTQEMTEATEQATTQQTTYETPDETQTDDSYLGTITLEVGQCFSMQVPLETYTIVSDGASEVARAKLTLEVDDHNASHWKLTVKSCDVGTAYLYTNDGQLVAVIHVVAEEMEIDYSEYASESPSFEPPTFGFP